MQKLGEKCEKFITTNKDAVDNGTVLRDQHFDDRHSPAKEMPTAAGVAAAWSSLNTAVFRHFTA